jgi:hypothetical protein
MIVSIVMGVSVILFVISFAPWFQRRLLTVRPASQRRDVDRARGVEDQALPKIEGREPVHAPGSSALTRSQSLLN